MAPTYDGPKVPRWFAEGVRLRIKSTKALRDRGLFLPSTRSYLWPGEVGTLCKRTPAHGETWSWAVEFGLDRTLLILRPETLEHLSRYQPKDNE